MVGSRGLVALLEGEDLEGEDLEGEDLEGEEVPDGIKLPPGQAEALWTWWNERPRTKAWAERHGSFGVSVERVQKFLFENWRSISADRLAAADLTLVAAGPASTSSSGSAAVWLREIKACEREGELFQAYDIAIQGLAQHPTDLALKQRAVLILASSGATEQAAELFTKLELGLSDSELTALPPALRMDIPCLNRRLRKDVALASSGEKQRAKLREAADLYESCFRREATASDPEAYYPATNAATLRLLAGDCEPAAELARQTVTWLDARPERLGYYELVSAAEAHLVLGNIATPGELMRLARAKVQGTAVADYRALAATIRQLRLVIDANGLDPSVLIALTPPRVLHYSGHMIARPGIPGRFPADQEQRVQEEIEQRLQGRQYRVRLWVACGRRRHSVCRSIVEARRQS